MSLLSRASVALAAECFSSPLLAPGLLLLGCRDDQLHCLKLDGEAGAEAEGH
jgi:hypothetical protein